MPNRHETSRARYAIEALYRVGHGSNWEPLPDQDNHQTFAEAEQAIEQLRTLGGDWAEGEYRIVKWPQQWPVIDGDGRLTGHTTDAEETGWLIYDDRAAIRSTEAMASGWWIDIEAGIARPADDSN